MEPTETERWSQAGLGENSDESLLRGIGRATDGVHTDSVSVECHNDGTTGVVVVAGELDLEGGDVVEVAVTELLKDGVTDVSVDARRLTFIDSSGLAGLIAARAHVVAAGGTFRLGPTTDQVARVIDLAGVHDLLGPEAN